jgi:copper chaperone CopZ
LGDDRIEKSENESKNESKEFQESEKLKLNIKGMTCASCVSKIEGSLRNLTGINKANVNLGLSSQSWFLLAIVLSTLSISYWLGWAVCIYVDLKASKK